MDLQIQGNYECCKYEIPGCTDPHAQNCSSIDCCCYSVGGYWDGNICRLEHINVDVVDDDGNSILSLFYDLFW